MKKRITVFLLAALFLFGLAPFTANASSNIYFIAINNSLQDDSLQTTPIYVNGITYIPVTIFSSKVTKEDLGVYYGGWSTEKGTVTLYSKEFTLEFDINTGTAYHYGEEQTYPYQVWVQNGMPYVPAVSICNHFGLICSFLITSDGQYQMLRIKNDPDKYLSDSKYLQAARVNLEERTQAYNQAAEQAITKPTNPTSPVETPEELRPELSQEEGPDIPVFIGIRVDSGANLNGAAAAMQRGGQTHGAFFFHTGQVAEYASLLRQLVGSGQRVGLIAAGDSAEEKLENLEAANQKLEHILRQRTVFVLDDGFSDEVKEGLREWGYISWQPNVTVSSQGLGSTSLAHRVAERAMSRTGRIRVLLDAGTTGSAISAVLSQLRDEGCEIRALRETNY